MRKEDREGARVAIIDCAYILLTIFSILYLNLCVLSLVVFNMSCFDLSLFMFLYCFIALTPHLIDLDIDPYQYLITYLLYSSFILYASSVHKKLFFKYLTLMYQ